MKVSVFDVSGRLLFADKCSQFSFQVPKTGLYILKIDEETEKVLVI